MRGHESVRAEGEVLTVCLRFMAVNLRSVRTSGFSRVNCSAASATELLQTSYRRASPGRGSAP